MADDNLPYSSLTPVEENPFDSGNPYKNLQDYNQQLQYQKAYQPSFLSMLIRVQNLIKFGILSVLYLQMSGIGHKKNYMRQKYPIYMYCLRVEIGI